MYFDLLWKLGLLLALHGAEVVFQAPYNPKERQSPPEKTETFNARTLWRTLERMILAVILATR